MRLTVLVVTVHFNPVYNWKVFVGDIWKTGKSDITVTKDIRCPTNTYQSTPAYETP
jgi:hypothetical protein